MYTMDVTSLVEGILATSFQSALVWPALVSHVSVPKSMLGVSALPALALLVSACILPHWGTSASQLAARLLVDHQKLVLPL